MDYGPQTLWPDHCIQGSNGARLHEGLNLDTADIVIRKGGDLAIDSHSPFYENDKTTPTGLLGYLATRSLMTGCFVILAITILLLLGVDIAGWFGIEPPVEEDL